MERQTGQTPLELQDLPRLPAGAEHVWNYYHELSRTRQSGMAVNPISYQEMYSWGRLRGVRLLVWELSAVLGIDSAFLTHINRELKPAEKKS